jgi:hypothetical protein
MIQSPQRERGGHARADQLPERDRRDGGDRRICRRQLRNTKIAPSIGSFSSTARARALLRWVGFGSARSAWSKGWFSSWPVGDGPAASARPRVAGPDLGRRPCELRLPGPLGLWRGLALFPVIASLIAWGDRFAARQHGPPALLVGPGDAQGAQARAGGSAYGFPPRRRASPPRGSRPRGDRATRRLLAREAEEGRLKASAEAAT